MQNDPFDTNPSQPFRTRIISGFPGVGKSYFARNHPDVTGHKVLDSDSSQFSWTGEGESKIRNPEWPGNYIAHIKANMGSADTILVSSHKEVRLALGAEKIPFILVYPSPSIKAEYIQRYIDRLSTNAFVELLTANYEQWIGELMQQTGCSHLILGPGEYLADVC